MGKKDRIKLKTVDIDILLRMIEEQKGIQIDRAWVRKHFANHLLSVSARDRQWKQKIVKDIKKDGVLKNLSDKYGVAVATIEAFLTNYKKEFLTMYIIYDEQDRDTNG